MNTNILKDLGNQLTQAVADKFNLEGDVLNTVSRIGQNSLIDTLKQYVMKNGSKEIEDILLQKSGFESSGLQAAVQSKLKSDLQNEGKQSAEKAGDMAGFASGFLVENIVKAFQTSGSSKDLEGICTFLGIDKNLLKMVNSPVGKMFGKFFK